MKIRRVGMSEKNCTQCGSDKVLQDLALQAGVGQLAVIVEGNPDAVIFKDAKILRLQATVCAECGNVDLFVENPNELWETYNKINS